MSEHTKGPWRVHTDQQSVIGGDGFSIGRVDHISIVPGWAERFPDIQHWADAPGRAHIEREDEEVAANTHLIAAAPDMYAALRAVLEDDDRIDGGILSEPRRSQLRAALARAKAK